MAYVKNGTIHKPSFYSDTFYHGESEKEEVRRRLRRVIEREMDKGGYDPFCFKFKLAVIQDQPGGPAVWVMLAEPFCFKAFWHVIPD